MIIRLLYIFLFTCILAGCSLFRKKPSYKQENTYQEISDINSHQTPKEIAKDLGNLSKQQNKAYKKEQRRARKAIKKRNKKKLKGEYFDK